MSGRISKVKLDKAKKLYMDFHSISEISRATSISRTTISHHVNKEGGWEYERNIARAELLDKVSSARKSDFAQMTSSAIVVIKRAIQTLASREEPPSVQEAKGATAILEVLDKITRLDEGNPTDIIQNEKPATIVEIREKLAKDPFGGIENANFKEIDHNPSDSSDD